MAVTLSRIAALLLAVAILLTGHGLQLSLLPLHAQGLGWSASAIGFTGSAYFLGFVAGCWAIPRFVARVGHVRAFMVLGATATIALLAAGLLVSFPAWLLLRLMTGFALSGLYMVIESWLSEVSPREQRGAVLGVYTMICLVAMSFGQAFLGLLPTGLELFAVGAMLLCAAILPVGMARVSAPHPLPSAGFSPRVLLRASRVAVVCAFFGGLATGAFWTVGPVMGRQFDLAVADIGVMMSAGILGGALAQLPVGWLSDRFERRVVIGTLMGLGALVGLIGPLLVKTDPSAVYACMFLIGAFTMPIYALCIAHASLNSDIPLVEIASGVLIMNSLGSIIGPMAAAALVDGLGPSAYFGYICACLLPGAAWALYRRMTGGATSGHEHAAILPRTTQVVVELAPAPPADHSDGADGDADDRCSEHE